VDVIILLTLIPLLGIATLACRRHHGEGAGRVKCASNLRQIGQGLLLYANQNKGAYPRTIYVADGESKPVWGTGASAKNPFEADGPQPNDVSAAMFLLIRTQDIGAEVFTCPETYADKDPFVTTYPPVRSNFTDVKKNLSYSIANPYPKDGVIKGPYWSGAVGPDFAIAADINPGTAGNGDNVLGVRTGSSANDMKRGNTNNHDDDGQNVLYGDGHVEFHTNPFVASSATTSTQRRRAWSSARRRMATTASCCRWMTDVWSPLPARGEG
jgi:prepilin-type processing-associated H-X9-DG protein